MHHSYRRPRRLKKGYQIALALLGLAALAAAVKWLWPGSVTEAIKNTPGYAVEIPEWVDVDPLPLNEWSRPGEPLTEVNGIVIHYVGNPGTSAQANRNYFAQPDTQVSAHFLIGLEGEIIQCIPLNEKSSATNDRNRDTLSIEVCHPDATGQFTQASYDALVRLTAWLCDTAGIGRDQVIRHYDVTGKLCPLYFVEHPEAWEQFLADVAAY